MGRLSNDRQMVRVCQTCAGSGAVSPVLFLSPCPDCEGTGRKEQRCPQCWTWKSPLDFKSHTGRFVRRCTVCTGKYKDWDKKTLEEREKATTPRSAIRSDGPLRVSFVVESGNRKTGPIPVSMTSSRSCPLTCPLYNRGCYAEQHIVAIHWRRISDGGGIEWGDFVSKVSALPPGQLWRHNEAGDLPGDDGKIDALKLGSLARANRGKRGFTYTHKPLTKLNLKLIRSALGDGFTINISTDSLDAADAAAELGLPVVTVLPHDAPPKGNRTPAGRHIVVCPAELREEVTCERCGLCAVAGRKSIVAFRAHGDRKKQITTRMRQLPLIK